MSTELRVACLVAALAGACGEHNSVQRVEQPSLERLAPEGSDSDRLGTSAVPGFLRVCETRATAPGLIELSCGEHQLVEFRKIDLEGEAGDDQELDELMGVLEARFGQLNEERSDARIDDAPIRVSHFVQAGEAGVQGIAASIGNLEGHYWALACYRRDQPVSEDFCGDAIATAARSGGLAHVEARAMQEFGEGKLRVGDGCELSPGRGINCATGKLSWSTTGLDASELQAETIANLQGMATQEKVALEAKKKSCTLLGKSAECQWLRLHDSKAGDELNFILAIGGDQERLVVCTFPGSMPVAAPLPEPCAQALMIEGNQ